MLSLFTKKLNFISPINSHTIFCLNKLYSISIYSIYLLHMHKLIRRRVIFFIYCSNVSAGDSSDFRQPFSRLQQQPRWCRIRTTCGIVLASASNTYILHKCATTNGNPRKNKRNERTFKNLLYSKNIL